MNTIFILLLISFMFTGLSGGIYPLLRYYISGFSRWHKPATIIFWISWLAGIVFALIAYVKVMEFADIVSKGGC